ncbi:hypothetical protein HMN09_00925500 [Mycena chlorophos]|uniref:Uncharacterized protein n=1 Tax=Mycena chlorophos TaxID=658473 RepID=A0A8H6SIT6_MYCCL|nr:hypothetical protein HMN09_00925500 [Mycena chlorophos]
MGDLYVPIGSYIFTSRLSFFQAPPAATEFAVVLSIQRLSHKYNVTWLFQRAVEHMTITHPTTLDGWDALQVLPPSGNFMQGTDVECCMAVVVMARELRLDWMLPRAFYRLARHRTEALAILQSDLALADKASLFNGVRLLDTEWRRKALAFLSEPLRIAGCTADKPSRCSDVRVAWKKTVEKSDDGRALKGMPLDFFNTANWSAWMKSGLVCQQCAKEMTRGKRAGHEAFWAQLPEIFGLGTWDTLELMKNETLKKE